MAEPTTSETARGQAIVRRAYELLTRKQARGWSHAIGLARQEQAPAPTTKRRP